MHDFIHGADVSLKSNAYTRLHYMFTQAHQWTCPIGIRSSSIQINITTYKTTYFTEQHFCISSPSCVLHTPPDALITLIRLCKKYKL